MVKVCYLVWSEIVNMSTPDSFTYFDQAIKQCAECRMDVPWRRGVAVLSVVCARHFFFLIAPRFLCALHDGRCYIHVGITHTQAFVVGQERRAGVGEGDRKKGVQSMGERSKTTSRRLLLIACLVGHVESFAPFFSSNGQVTKRRGSFPRRQPWSGAAGSASSRDLALSATPAIELVSRKLGRLYCRPEYKIEQHYVDYCCFI